LPCPPSLMFCVLFATFPNIDLLAFPHTITHNNPQPHTITHITTRNHKQPHVITQNHTQSYAITRPRTTTTTPGAPDAGAGKNPKCFAEERSHFGLWCIMSSPLVRASCRHHAITACVLSCRHRLFLHRVIAAGTWIVSSPLARGSCRHH
jgi:hypothetical protein